MKKASKYRVDISLWICLLIFIAISLVSIYSAGSIMPAFYTDVFVKQIAWFIIGLVFIFIIMTLGSGYFFRHAKTLYIIGIVLLLLVLFFGIEVNGARRWFEIPFLGFSFQPSEFMKIPLILMLAVKISDYNEVNHRADRNEELRLIGSCFLITLIPSVLTFLEPDTAPIIFYFATLFIMLFISGINRRWFVIGITALLSFAVLFFVIYFINSNLFISLFGTGSFYRIDRVLSWTSGDAYQLTNALAAMGNGGLFGDGIRNIALYFPEAHTDFIFAVLVSTFGFLGGMVLILTFTWFIIKIISLTYTDDHNITTYLVSGIAGYMIVSILINIGMVLGLIPIIGITLPFISYGGSSVLTMMIMAGLLFTVNNEKIRFTN